MKPSRELIAAAKEAFYNNHGDETEDPFELMFETLSERGYVEFGQPAAAMGVWTCCGYPADDDHHPACKWH